MDKKNFDRNYIINQLCRHSEKITILQKKQINTFLIQKGLMDKTYKCGKDNVDLGIDLDLFTDDHLIELFKIIKENN